MNNFEEFLTGFLLKEGQEEFDFEEKGWRQQAKKTQDRLAREKGRKETPAEEKRRLQQQERDQREQDQMFIAQADDLEDRKKKGSGGRR